MQNPTPLPEWENTKIPWIRAADISKPPLDIRAQVRPLYHVPIMFGANMIIVMTLSYIAMILTFYAYTLTPHSSTKLLT